MTSLKFDYRLLKESFEDGLKRKTSKFHIEHLGKDEECPNGYSRYLLTYAIKNYPFLEMNGMSFCINDHTGFVFNPNMERKEEWVGENLVVTENFFPTKGDYPFAETLRMFGDSVDKYSGLPSGDRLK